MVALHIIWVILCYICSIINVLAREYIMYMHTHTWGRKLIETNMSEKESERYTAQQNEAMNLCKREYMLLLFYYPQLHLREANTNTENSSCMKKKKNQQWVSEWVEHTNRMLAKLVLAMILFSLSFTRFFVFQAQMKMSAFRTQFSSCNAIAWVSIEPFSLSFRISSSCFCLCIEDGDERANMVRTLYIEIIHMNKTHRWPLTARSLSLSLSISHSIWSWFVYESKRVNERASARQNRRLSCSNILLQSFALSHIHFSYLV